MYIQVHKTHNKNVNINHDYYVFRDGKLSEPGFPGYKDCHPRRKVAFLKTHKCASSTIQNTLMRFAVKNNLNVVLPLTGNYVGRYMPFHRTVLYGTPWQAADLKYDIFCLHTIWNGPEVAQVMGKGAFYFTILRDPVDLFISLWDYASMKDLYNVDLESYIFADKTVGHFKDRSKISNLGRNQMLWDFGFPAKLFDNETAIDLKIKEIDRKFDLVLIAEQFDESMILLKEQLCWDFVDITYLSLNAHKKETKSKISEEARRELANWLKGDYMLYNFFRRKFGNAKTEFGENRMSQQLQILSKANQNIEKKCSIQPKDNSLLEGEYKLWGKDMIGYTMSDEAEEFCKYYVLSEMSFIDHLRSAQGDRAKVILEKQNRTFVGYNPQQFQPLSMRDKNGKIDIRGLKSKFNFH